MNAFNRLAGIVHRIANVIPCSCNKQGWCPGCDITKETTKLMAELNSTQKECLLACREQGWVDAECPIHGDPS